MTAGGFWKRAWEILSALQDGPQSGEEDVATVVAHSLRDLTLQRYIFNHRGFANPNWLRAFRREGLFAEPPQVETIESGGVRASGWPVLTYLRHAGPNYPIDCAEILLSIHSDNWWVLSDALAVAVELEDSLATRPILSLLRQWERSSVQWTQPEVLAGSIEHLARQPDVGVLVEALFRVARRFVDDPRNHYDLEELISELRTRIGEVRSSSVADAIEEVLQFKAAGTDWRAYSHGLDDRRSSDDALDLLIREWLDALETESKLRGTFAPFRRAARLLDHPVALLRQMGLRALGFALAGDDPEPQALTLLTRVCCREDLTSSYEDLPELLRLFREQMPLLDRTHQAELLQRLVDQASSAEQLDRVYARDWLYALRRHLSARELTVLDSLTQDLGRPREEFARPVVHGVWVGPRSPVTAEELATMPVPDLLGILSHVPVQPSVEWPIEAGSPEGLGRLLQPLVKGRIAEFWPHLGSFAEAAEYSVLIFYLSWGLRDAFASAEARQSERLESLVDFITVTVRRARAGEFRVVSDPRYQDDHIGRGIADLVESVGDWLVDSPRTDELVEVLKWLLESDDPPQTAPDEDTSDPPTLAINSVRGEAVLAALRIRAQFWGDDARPASRLAQEVSNLLELNVAAEPSPAVLSSYGRYLAAIVTYWRDFFDQHEAHLLPTQDELLPRWGAVFGTYLTFYGPHRRTAQRLRRHYELAVSRLPAIQDTFLGKHAERLVMHLTALALPRADDSPDWTSLLHDALAAAPAEVNTRAIHDLSFAIEREGTDVPAEWVLTFVSERTTALALERGTDRPMPSTPPTSRSNEMGALLELLFATRTPVQPSIGLIRSLMALGARPSIDDVVDYLSAADPEYSLSGATTLLLAVKQDVLNGYMARLDAAKSLVRGYATTHPSIAWQVVDAFGSRGAFAFEDVAREVATALDER